MPSVPFRVKALYEYTSPHEDDLHFPGGQIITVTEEEDADWYNGEFVDDAGVKHEGIFPRNFVEKFEPQAPPRPTRTRTKKEADPAPVAEPSAPIPPPQPLPTPAQAAEEEDDDAPTPAASGVSQEPPAPVPSASKPAEAVPAHAPVPSASKPSEPPASASQPRGAPGSPKVEPPPVSEKPNSFRDRIAAFNKAAAPPIAPFKPSGLAAGGSGFIKKPFVAPPPSRNAYVPPPREAPTAKVYRRDEDPEIKEREAETQESAEKAGLVPSASPEEGDPDQPKPTSLKERIALLQKQQLEQASRHAEAAAKKEKPKRPAKKRTESHEQPEGPAEVQTIPPVPEASQDTDETGGKRSMDSARVPPPPRRKSSRGPIIETINDGNEADMSGAGDTTEGPEDITERDDSDEKPQPLSRATSGAVAEAEKEVEDEEEDEEAGDEEEEDDDEDPEARRKEELRARMMKMSGGMGMHGMFGPPGMMPMGGPPPPKKKKSQPEPQLAEQSEEETSPVSRAPPVPVPGMMALPGMGQIKRPDERRTAEEEPPLASPRAPPPPARPVESEDDDVDVPVRSPPPSLPSRDPAGPPPIPSGRPMPPPVPTDSRPVPPALAARSPSIGSESDDELSGGALETPKPDISHALRSPPPLPPSLPSPVFPSSARSPPSMPAEFSPTSPTAPVPPSKRNSRPPPPIPGAAPALPPAQNRPPPPPPPGALSRQSTADTRLTSPARPAARAVDDDEDEEVTEYEGDYDTDIASSVPHKDALKSHSRDSNLEDSTFIKSPVSEAPPSLPPPLPTGSAPRAIPPPIPSQPPPDKRRSVDVPRAAPPPPPPKEATPQYDDDYDPFNYAPPKAAGYSATTPKIEEEEYFQESPLMQSPSQERRGPPVPSTGRAPPRQSLDVSRTMAAGRRSMDAHRPSMESGFIANDIDLAKQSGWWRQANQVPPVLQGRRDIFFESEESTSTNRGAKTMITRTIFILYQDYSQTVLTVRFDPYDPSDVELEQRHEPPPRSLRQDQLEQSYDRFGRPISEAVAAKKDTVVGDGTPQGLIHELIKPFRDVLSPVGTRAYGALVYSNMANASTQQNDQIRPGDIITIRNAKFQGKHGPMHAKYSMEVGKPDHVAVVAEWDGTKKKVRAWEQGRESKKVKIESFKLDDLRSGELKIWRVMPRAWIGWNTQP